jgi:glycine cleavage system transcriptional repressor
MIIDVPAHVQISQLREDFLDLCDEDNLDAVMEPIKP